MGAVLDDLSAPEQSLDGRMHAEIRLEVLDLDLLPRQVFRRDDESKGDGRLVRVQESSTAEAHRRVPRVYEGGPFLLAKAESILNRLRRQLHRFLDSDRDFSGLQIRFQARLSYQRRPRTLRENNEVRCDVVVRRDGDAPHPTALPPEVVDTDPGDEHRPGVLGFLRQPRVELRAERGEACPATLGELRGIERDREGRVLGQESEILPDDEPLDRAVLRPFRKQLDQGPRIDATPEHPLHSGSPAALDEKGREALAGEGQRGRGARGSGPHHDDIKTLHALPVPLRKSGTGKRLSAGSRHRHRLQLELAPLVALRGARELFAEKLLPDEEAADPGHPTGEEVAHRLLRGAVRLGDRAVVSRHREPTSIRVEVDDLRPPPSGERGRVDDSLRAVHRQREGDSARQRAEEFQTGIRAPLAGQIQDPFGGSAHALVELPLDAHDDLGAEDETRLVRETQDPGFRIGMEGRREEFARLLRVQFREVHLRIDRGGLAIAGGHRSYPWVLRQTSRWTVTDAKEFL